MPFIASKRSRAPTTRIASRARRRSGLRAWPRVRSVGREARLLAGREGPLLAAAVDRLLLDRRQPALVVEDDQHVLELVEVRRRLEERGLDDIVGIALDVDDLADEQALRVGRADPAGELDAGRDDLVARGRCVSPASIWFMTRTPPSCPTTSPVAAVGTSWPMTVDSASVRSMTVAPSGPTSVTRPASAPPRGHDDVADADAVAGALVDA